MLTKNNLFKPLKANNNSDVELAKTFPIQDLYHNNLKKMGKTLMGCCPFHDEENPSFAIYPETNSWNCFAGCGGGDVISFYMKLNNVDFNTAVKELTSKL